MFALVAIDFLIPNFHSKNKSIEQSILCLNYPWYCLSYIIEESKQKSSAFLLKNVNKSNQTWNNQLVKNINDDHKEGCIFHNGAKISPAFFASRPCCFLKKFEDILNKTHSYLLSRFSMCCVFTTMFTKFIYF